MADQIIELHARNDVRLSLTMPCSNNRNTNEGIDGSTSHLAAFITSYTFVAEVYDEIPELLMTALNQMANVAIVNFAKLSYYNRIDCTIAIERLLISLFNKGEGVLRGFFDKFCTSQLYPNNFDRRNASMTL